LLSTASSATGAIAGPDASGYYTATILNKFPAGAMLRSVSLQGYFSQVTPVTVPATADVPRHAVSVVKAITGDTVRRTAIDSAKCASCHEWFEGHGGNRVYQVQVCVTCHVPGLTTSGKGSTNTQVSNYYPSFTANDKDSLTRWTGVDFLTSNPAAAYAAANTASPDIALLFPQTTNNFKDMIHGIHAGKRPHHAHPHCPQPWWHADHRRRQPHWLPWHPQQLPELPHLQRLQRAHHRHPPRQP
jgi:hypothetical protein